MAKNPIWLGIDPGLAIIGWAILEELPTGEANLIDSGTIQTSKTTNTPVRLFEIEKDMVEIIQEYQPNNIAMEMPFFSRQIKAAGGVLQAVGVINLVCFRELGLEPIMLHQSSWKAHLGDGKATKSDVAETLSNLFDLEKLPLDDTVDAIGIGYAGLCGLKNLIK